jgi:hypothetical protein
LSAGLHGSVCRHSLLLLSDSLYAISKLVLFFILALEGFFMDQIDTALSLFKEGYS